MQRAPLYIYIYIYVYICIYMYIYMYIYISGQIIATSSKVTPRSVASRNETPRLFQGFMTLVGELL